MVLKYFSNAIKKKCTAFILSDFIDTNDFEQAMLLANKKHDLVALQIYDKRETELPNVGLLKIKDAETGEIVLVDSSNKAIRDLYQSVWNKKQYKLNQVFNRCRVDNVSIDTTEDYVKSLLKLFRLRS